MKKILSFALAAAMMTTVAFAEEEPTFGDNVANPGQKLTIPMNGFTFAGTDSVLGEAEEGGMVAGLKDYEFNTDNFTLTVKYRKGADLVESAKIDDEDNEVVIKFKKNNLLERPASNKAPNLIFDKIEVKSRRSIKNDEKEYILKAGKVFEVTDLEGNESWKVGYDVEGNEELYLSELTGDDYEIKNFGGYNVIADMNEGSTEPKAFMMYDGDGFRLEGKVYAGDKFYIDIDHRYDDVMDIVKANEDADFTVYNVTADGLSSTVKMWLTDIEKETNIYKYSPDTKKLTKANAKWSEEELSYYTTFRDDTIIITSETALKGVSSSGNMGSNENPNTGR